MVVLKKRELAKWFVKAIENDRWRYKREKEINDMAITGMISGIRAQQFKRNWQMSDMVEHLHSVKINKPTTIND